MLGYAVGLVLVFVVYIAGIASAKDDIVSKVVRGIFLTIAYVAITLFSTEFLALSGFMLLPPFWGEFVLGTSLGFFVVLLVSVLFFAVTYDIVDAADQMALRQAKRI